MRTNNPGLRQPSICIGIDFSQTGTAIAGFGVDKQRQVTMIPSIKVPDVTGRKVGARKSAMSLQNRVRGTTIVRALMDIGIGCGGKEEKYAPWNVRIVMEDYAMRAIGNVCDIAEAAGTLKEKLYTELQVSPHHLLLCTPQHLKMFATNKGNAKKEEVLKAVYKRWDMDTDDNDIADAYVLSHICLAMFFNRAYQTEQDPQNPTWRLTEYQEDIIGRVVEYNRFSLSKKRKKRAPKKNAKTS